MRFVPARGLHLLVNGEQAFPAMLAAIDEAQQSVDLETYILYDDVTGRSFREALCRAASRGVRVRLLYDWLGSFGLPVSFHRPLIEAGADVATFHPLVWRRPVWAINKRDHRKMLIVDNQLAFTGGLNITDEYAPTSIGGQGWRDTHVQLDGPEVAREMVALFEYAWRRAAPYHKTLKRRTRFKWGIQKKLKLRKRRGKQKGTRTPAASKPYVAIVGNELFRYRRRIDHAYLRAISAAQRYVLIENAYFIPRRAVRQALIRAARRGVCVAVVVAARSNVTITAYARRWSYDELLAGGVRIFEWPISMMHAKTAIVDDAWSIVGSYNFDHRSLLNNLESVAVIADPALAAQLRDQTLADIGRCKEVLLETHRQRPRAQKAFEYLAYLLRHWL